MSSAGWPGAETTRCLFGRGVSVGTNNNANSQLETSASTTSRSPMSVRVTPYYLTMPSSFGKDTGKDQSGRQTSLRMHLQPFPLLRSFVL